MFAALFAIAIGFICMGLSAGLIIAALPAWAGWVMCVAMTLIFFGWRRGELERKRDQSEQGGQGGQRKPS